MEWTDGLGVRITQKSIGFRAAQTVRILNLDYLICLHLANYDSSHNEVERVQSYVGDAKDRPEEITLILHKCKSLVVHRTTTCPTKGISSEQKLYHWFP